MTSCACINTKYSVVVCDEHKCRCSGCENKKNEWSSNDSCEEHEFQCFVVGCHELHCFEGDYCGNHKCVIDGCVGRFFEDSRHCDEHACKHKFYGAIPCGNKKLTGKDFCEEHCNPKCRCVWCDERKGENKDSCERHSTKCFAEGCDELKCCESDYCFEHKCAIAGCDDIHIKGNCNCDAHACKFQIDEGLECKNKKLNGMDFCEEHYKPKCQAPGCDEKKIKWYPDDVCKRHSTMCFVVGCDEPHFWGYNYCEDHKCAFNGCDDRHISGNPHCDAHTCKYNIDEGLECKNKKDVGKNLCGEHTCRALGCDKKRLDWFDVCEEHEKMCFIKGCDNFAKEGGMFDYCEEHNCKIRWCNSGRIKGSRNCDEHACMFKFGEGEACNEERQKGRKRPYCSDHEYMCHRCGIQPDEDEEIVDGSDFCKMCVCGYGFTGCIKEKLPGRSHCREHSCGFELCRRINDGGEFCTRHNCKMCRALITDVRHPCMSHRCVISQCKAFREKGYTCENHNCSVDKCTRDPVGVSLVCDEHICKAPGCIEGVQKSGVQKVRLLP